MLDFSSQYGNDDSISYTAHNIVGRSAIAILTFSLFTRPFSTDLMFQHAGQASSPPMATSLRLLSCETMDPGGETAQVERSGVSPYLAPSHPRLEGPTSLIRSSSTRFILSGYTSMKPTTLVGLLAFGLGTAGDRGAGFFLIMFHIIYIRNDCECYTLTESSQ